MCNLHTEANSTRLETIWLNHLGMTNDREKNWSGTNTPLVETQKLSTQGQR